MYFRKSDMMTNFYDLIMFPFFQNALYVSVLLSILCGITGSYVVLKRLSFLSGSVSHSAFGGIGVALYYGFNPLIGALGFGIGSGIIMEWIRIHYKQEADSLIGLVWALGMAIGIFFVHFSKGFAPDLNSFLFGNILLCTKEDVWIIGTLLGICMVLNWLL
jgi:zinc transport system permease protein